MHTRITLTLCFLKTIIDSRWVRKEERFVKGSSISMSESANEESRLDRLEVKVAKIAEQLLVLTNLVARLTVPCVANNRNLCNQNGRTVGEPSRTKPTPSEIAPIKNRQFSNLGKPLSKVFEKLKMKGLLKPLKPKPLQNPPPPYLKIDRYCHFHQQHGHFTDSCSRLRHEIQDLIDSHKIPNPEKEQPDTHRKPPPAYMINAGLPDSLVPQTHNHQTYRIRIQDNMAKME